MKELPTREEIERRLKEVQDGIAARSVLLDDVKRRIEQDRRDRG